MKINLELPTRCRTRSITPKHIRSNCFPTLTLGEGNESLLSLLYWPELPSTVSYPNHNIVEVHLTLNTCKSGKGE